jgi:hypothetical protein
MKWIDTAVIVITGLFMYFVLAFINGCLDITHWNIRYVVLYPIFVCIVYILISMDKDDLLTH